MSQEFESQPGQSTILEERALETAPPPMFKVIMLNDDFTPMEFVVEVLQRFFAKSSDEAVQLMLSVHHQGRAICGVYPRDIASTKIEQVTIYAKQYQHPLQCILEET